MKQYSTVKLIASLLTVGTLALTVLCMTVRMRRPVADDVGGLKGAVRDDVNRG